MINSDLLANTDLASVTGVILAGGLGTRLRSVVADRPKVLAEINGRPCLAYLLDQLADAGIREVVLCIGYLGEHIKAMFGDKYGNLRLSYSQESSLLGTAGALRLALPLINSSIALVMNGDSFCYTNLQDFWHWHNQKKAKGTLLLTQVPDTKRYGRVQVEADGHLISFEEKGETSGTGWINAGIYLLSHQILTTIPIDKAVALEQEMFPCWLSEGLYGYCSQGKFLDIGTPESYAKSVQFFTGEAV